MNMKILKEELFLLFFALAFHIILLNPNQHQLWGETPTLCEYGMQ